MKKYLIAISIFLMLENSNSQCTYEIDSTFGMLGSGAKVIDTNIVKRFIFETLLKNSDSSYYLLGQQVQNSKYLGTIIKLDKNGNVDKTYGDKGKLFIDTAVFGQLHYGVEINSNEILVGGSRSTEVFVAKYDKSGRLIQSFGKIGIFADKKAFSGGECTEIKFDSDRNIFVSGYSATRNVGPFVLKLKPNGILDSTFGTNGYFRLITPIETFEARVHLEVINDGLIFGYSTGSGNLSEIVISKLDFKGKVDSIFGNKGILKLPNLTNMYLHSIAKLNDDILLFGECLISNKPYALLSKILLNGKLNFDFDPKGYKLYNANLAKAEVKCKNQIVIGSSERINDRIICSLLSIDLVTGNIDTLNANKGRLSIPFQSNLNEYFIVSDIIIKNDYITILGHNTDQATCLARGILNKSTQINHVQDIERLNCYPIPFSHYLTVDNLPENCENKIEIFNSNFMMVDRVVINGSSKFIFNSNNWFEGIYFVKVSNKQKSNIAKVTKL